MLQACVYIKQGMEVVREATYFISSEVEGVFRISNDLVKFVLNEFPFKPRYTCGKFDILFTEIKRLTHMLLKIHC